MSNTATVFVEQRPSRKYNIFNIAVLTIIGLLSLIAGWNLWWFVIACFLPAVAANARGHNNALAITALNVVVYFISSRVPEGFTIFVIVWTGALVWACLNQRRD